MKFNKRNHLFLLGGLLVLVSVALSACSGSTQKSVSAAQQTNLPPAQGIQVSALAINPPEVDAGVEALITARVTNTSTTPQSYIGEVKVENGKSLPEFWYSSKVSIAAGDTKLVGVVINENKAGTYKVNWSSLSSELVVKPAQLSEPGQTNSNVPVNVTAPDFAATELITGQKISLSQYKGKVILLNFVNYGCDPRLNDIVDKQFQAIKQLVSQRQDFVPISVFCGCCLPDVLRQFTKENGFNWPWILDSDNSVARKYISYLGRFGYPTLVVIDANQTIREATGFKDLTALSSSLDQALSK